MLETIIEYHAIHVIVLGQVRAQGCNTIRIGDNIDSWAAHGVFGLLITWLTPNRAVTTHRDDGAARLLQQTIDDPSNHR